MQGTIQPTVQMVVPAGHPDAGEVVANCEVTPTEVTCTATTYVTGKNGFKGFKLYFNASANGTTDLEKLVFPINNTPGGVEVDLPGEGGIVGIDPINEPEEPQKFGWLYSENAGQAFWRIFLSAKDLPAAGVFTIVDRLGQGQVLLPSTVRVAGWNTDAIAWNANNPFVVSDPRLDGEVDYFGHNPPTRYTVTNPLSATEPNAFSVAVTPKDGIDIYMIEYRTQIHPDTTNGTVLTNSVDGYVFSETPKIDYYYSAGGSGSGNPIPDLRISKTVVGEPTTTEFAFDVVCTLNGATRTFTPTVTLDAPVAVIEDVAAGSMCTVTETTVGADEVTYTLNNVDLPAPRTFEVRESQSNVMQIGVTNTYNEVPEPTGGFSLEKVVAGEVGAIPADMETFDVTYTVTPPAGAASYSDVVSLTPGADPVVIGDVPIGSEVTFEENPVAIDGYTWSTEISPETISIAEACMGGGVAAPGGGIIGGVWNRAAEIETDDCTNAVAVTVTNTLTKTPDELGAFTIQKFIDADIPTGTTFTVEYTVTARDDTELDSGSVEIAAGDDAMIFGGYPLGSKVSIEEVTPDAISGFTWAAPVYNVTGPQEITKPCETANPTDGSECLEAVVFRVTNKLTKVTPSPTPSSPSPSTSTSPTPTPTATTPAPTASPTPRVDPTPTPTPVETATPTPTPVASVTPTPNPAPSVPPTAVPHKPVTPPLASTGSTLPWAIALGGGGLVALGLVFLALRGRTSRKR